MADTGSPASLGWGDWNRDEPTDLVCSWCGKQEKDCEAAQSGREIQLVPRDEYEMGRPACLK